MLIRDTTWEAIRTLFSEEEKVQLRATVTGETICPRGFCINPDALAPELRSKIQNAVKEAQRAL